MLHRPCRRESSSGVFGAPCLRCVRPLPARPLGLGTILSIRTVTTGTGGFIPFRSTRRNRVFTAASFFVQYVLISRYSMRFEPSTIFANHSRLMVVVIVATGLTSV